MEIDSEKQPDHLLPSTETQDVADCEEPTTSKVDINPLYKTKEINQSCLYTITNKLVRIQYPGIVENLDNALETLGGMQSIERAVFQPTNKLQLNLHPKSVFNKCCFADSDSNAGFLLKIKLNEDENSGDSSECSYEIIGYTVKSFTFNRMVDFQYLPLIANHPETVDSHVDYIYDSIIPKELPLYSAVLEDGNSGKVPLFLIPTFFSRIDIPKKFSINEKVETCTKKPVPVKKRVLKKCLAFQKHDPISIFRKFSDPDVPQQPLETVNQLISRKRSQNYVIVLQKLFEEKPIWTRSGIMAVSKFTYEWLKFLLPAVAYYYTTGPWRTTWVRYGYDPRVDPGARKYQTLDYRLPNLMRIQKYAAKRTTKILTATSLDQLFMYKDMKRNEVNENHYLLKPNMVPGSRQVFYQYCNILLPEVQSMLAKLPDVPSNLKCHPQLGWLPTNFREQCREIITRYVDEAIYNELVKSNEITDAEVTTETVPKSSDYVSLMIKNAKRGLQAPIVKQELPSTSYTMNDENSVLEISDSESEHSEDELNFDTNIYQDREDEEENMDIDADALEDIKNLIKDTNLNKDN